MTDYQKHRELYSGGCGNTICESARNVCLARGTLPCDVLFVGEAPGESEDVLGRPFVGPAGQLLDRMISDALAGRQLRLAFTNMVGCIPRGDDGKKLAEPDAVEIRGCGDRLIDLISIADPKLIVCVGALATKWLQNPATAGTICPRRTGIRKVHVAHPAAILRANVAQRGLMIQKVVVTLSTAFDEVG